MNCFPVTVLLEYIFNGNVTLFFQVKSQQSEMMRILDSKSIQYELIDISLGGELRNEMRSKAGDPTAAPPQLFNEDQYCGVRKALTLDTKSSQKLVLKVEYELNSAVKKHQTQLL